MFCPYLFHDQTVFLLPTEFKNVKWCRLFRAKIRKVETSFFAQIRQVSNTLTPSADVSGDTPVR